jgi:transcriptional regulator with XRE-family HTH domain
MVLVRHLLGGVLRRQRMRQGRTLRQVSADARVSLGYISEVERGQKEASSELLAAICAALDVPLSTVLQEVSEELAQVEQGVPAQAAPASAGAERERELVPAGAGAERERELVPARELTPSAPARDLAPTNSLSHEFSTSGELEPASAGVLPALSKRLETRLIDSQRISTPDNHPDVVAAA